MTGAPGVADFGYPESAARALGRAVERAAWLRRPLGTAPELDGIDEAAGEDAFARPPTNAPELLAWQAERVDHVVAIACQQGLSARFQKILDALPHVRDDGRPTSGGFEQARGGAVAESGHGRARDVESGDRRGEEAGVIRRW